jgi:Ca-activated chloride channel family protein
MNAIDLTLTPLRSGLLTGHDTTCLVLVSARAPAAPAAPNRTRPPLNLALVIDRSGSMSGQPLAEAKRCAEYVVNGLAPTDRASVIAYCDRVDVVASSQAVKDRGKLLRAIRSIRERGATALYDGWRIAADQALFGHSPEGLSRVLLLSDGNANRGPASAEEIEPKVGAVAAQGVSTSTYGLGHRFNEHLMMAMARAGQGNAYYGESAEDLMDPFREELDLLNALCARNLALTLESPSGIQIHLLNDYAQRTDGRWRLPDLAFGGEAWALTELRIPRDIASERGKREIEILRATLAYEEIDGGPRLSDPARLTLPLLPASAYEAIAENEIVRARAQELRAADIQEQARTAARLRQWERVDELLETARLESAGNPWLVQSVEVLAGYARCRNTERFSKEAYFKSRRLRSRLVRSDEGASQYDSVTEAGVPLFLRRKAEQGKKAGPER